MKKKKFPTSITILGRKVKIKQGRGLVYMGQPCLGLCNYDEKVIYLEKEQSDEMKYDTLLHEIHHFYLEFTGFSQKMSEAENEVACQMFTALFNDIKKIYE